MYQIHGLREKLSLGKSVVTVELEPPKGADPMPTMLTAKHLRGYVDAVNIADSPMATLRMSPIALSHIVQQDLGLEAIFHLTCRDRNILGLQSELLGAAALGVRNILTLTGDQPSRGDHPEARGVFEVDAIGLVKIAKRLNEGSDLAGKALNAPTDFFIGGAANPGADDQEVEFSKLRAKVEAGVRFVQTQPVFDVETALRYQERVVKEGLPVYVLYGILPLKSAKQARFLNEKVPGITIRREIIDRVEAGGREAGVEIAQELYYALKPHVAGVHLYPLNNLQTVYDVLEIKVEPSIAL
ncbi:methylenetetrahydrofolate reductase [Effusibacillus lacus]|uniref:Methylenetetrahydrofolate reductase n=1 Tax=Effusibacillus lacus TaxID=1348429 RepID=A0A292YMD5_9BACL|nr:methylenetetrahydrofolate reductase [Effusibacillus lacus]TCS70074.1 5,10-methylenetetrahydrofolate reductase [Effusibacillus lacus]GAX91088.1 5,10-methylenetetrahydrofolate reductase [Effusibacillus lacus]